MPQARIVEVGECAVAMENCDLAGLSGPPSLSLAVKGEAEGRE